MPNITRAVIFSLVLFATSAMESIAAEPVTIGFESLGRGEIVRGQFARQGLRVNARNWSHGPDAAVIFDTGNIGESDDEDLKSPFDPAAGSEAASELQPGHVLILHERNDCDSAMCEVPDDEGSRPAGWLEFEFAVPVTLHGMKVIDVHYESGEIPSKLVLFGAGGEIIESIDVPSVGGQGDWLPWNIERSGVARARLYLPGDGAIDDLSFTPASAVNWPPEFLSHPPVAVAPEGVYRYTPEILDMDGDSVTIRLIDGPEGMVVGDDGPVVWAPAGDTGTFPVEIEARDGRGSVVRQSFSIHVNEQFLRTQDFDFEAGVIVDDELVADGLRVSARNFSSGSNYAVVFDTEEPTGGDSDLAAPLEEGSENELGLGAMHPGKVLVLHEEHDCDVADRICAEPDDETTKPAGWIEFAFTQPAHVWSLDVFDITSDDPAARPIKLFGEDGLPLGLNVTVPRTGSNEWDRVVINAQNVHRMRVNLDGDGALDNLRYALVGSAESDNHPPVIHDEEFEIVKGTVLQVPAPGVLANDSDPDGDPVTAALDEAPWHGSVVLNLDGSFTYTPPPDFVGKDEFEYRVHDGESASIAEDVEVYVVEDIAEPEPEPEPEPGLPIAEIVSPSAGEWLADNTPEIIIEYPETGSGINFASLAISANGVNITATCTHQAIRSRCVPNTPLPEGQITLIANVADTAGTPAQPAMSTLQIDSIPPTAVVRDKVSLVQEPAGTVTIVGVPGAAEVGATIIIDFNGNETSVTAAADGSFQEIVAATTGDEIGIRVRDIAGNTSLLELFTVVAPLTINITSPPDGAHVTADRVTVRGTHGGMVNTGITVNGQRALVNADGSFVAVDVPLVAGANEIRAAAVTFAGEIAETIINVGSDAIPPLASITPTQSDGPAPMNAKFRISYHGDPNALHHFELDFDGDGVSDEVFTNADNEPSHTYLQPGQYEPRLLVFTTNSVLEATTVIRIASDTEMDAMFRALWSGWKEKLVDGDTDAALAYISPSRRERYRKLFDGLSGRWPQIFETFTNLEPAILSSGFSEYAVNRTIGGENRLFLIYFAQDKNGVWRLHSF